MSQYVSYSDGPGSIGALKPLAALSHAPTIGSNAPRRRIRNVAHTARSIPPMGLGAYSSGVFANGDGVFDGCGCMGTDANGNGAAAANGNGNGNGAAAATNGNGNGMGLPSWAPFVAIAAIAGGVWYMKKKKDEEADLSEF